MDDKKTYYAKKVTTVPYEQWSAEEKQEHCLLVCESLGLNPLTRPLLYYTPRGGGEILYATRSATDQLAKIHGLSYTITSEKTIENCYVVWTRVFDKEGRSIESIGASPLIKPWKMPNGQVKQDAEGNPIWSPMRGDEFCNAMMKAATKAYRRGVLAHTGLGLLDETEVETIPPNIVVQQPVQKPKLNMNKFSNNETEMIEPIESQSNNIIQEFENRIKDAKTMIDLDKIAFDIKQQSIENNVKNELIKLWKSSYKAIKDSSPTIVQS